MISCDWLRYLYYPALLHPHNRPYNRHYAIQGFGSFTHYYNHIDPEGVFLSV